MEVVRGMVWIFPGIAHYNIHAHIFFICTKAVRLILSSQRQV